MQRYFLALVGSEATPLFPDFSVYKDILVFFIQNKNIFITISSETFVPLCNGLE